LSSVKPPFDVLATVDMGSNSFRLQISRVVDDQLYTLDSLKDTVRLGGGLQDDKTLDSETLQRALACMARFGERLRGMDPKQVRVVGTNTLRVAKNAPEFIVEAERLLGFPIEIIAGREEARLIYLGAAHSLPATKERRLVVDIGGGSTEFIIGSGYKAHVTESLPLGCVVFSKRFFVDGKISKNAFRDAELAARNEIQRIVHEYPASEWQLAVGTSGTARALRDMMEANGWSNGEITLRGMKRLRDDLIACGHSKEIRILGLKDDRAPVLPGGLAIMIAIFESLAIEQMIVTDGALRDGVLYDLMGRQREKDMRDSTITQFKRRYHVDVPQAQRVAALAERLFRLVSGDALDPDMLKRVVWAAKVHEIGLTIAHAAYHKHSAYVLTNADMPGFSRREQSTLATIVLGHRGDMGKMVKEVADPALWPAVLSLRLAALFYRSRNELDINAVHGLTPTLNGYALTVGKDWLAANPLTTAAFRQEIALWRAIGVALELRGD